MSLWYPCLLSCLLHLAPRASREAGGFTALGCLRFFHTRTGPAWSPRRSSGTEASVALSSGIVVAIIGADLAE